MHIVLLVIGIILIIFLLRLNFGGRSPEARVSVRPRALPESRGPLSPEERRAVHDALEAKGKLPWLMREHGLGAISLGDGTLLSETFDYMDAYEAGTSFDIRDEKPLFAEGYDDQEGREDGFSRALAYHLKDVLPFPFRALAGNGKVDVVTLAEYGNTAYVFAVDKEPGDFMRRTGDNQFYYDVPKVLLALEDFIRSHPRMDKIIWLERETGFFLFVVQLANMSRPE